MNGPTDRTLVGISAAVAVARPKRISDDSLHPISLTELKDEANNGLKLYAETAWGWSELKVAAFLRQAERKNYGATIIGYIEVRKCGSLTVKIPLRA